MDSRDDILGRIRRRLGRTPKNASTAHGNMTSWLAAHPQGPRPPLEADLVKRFCEKSESLSSSVDVVRAMEDAPAAATRYLRRHALPLTAVCAPEVAALDWAAAGLGVTARKAHDEDLVGITACFCAIAETGTLMLCSSPASPSTVSLLPETHIALVDARRVVAGMEDAWQLAREAFRELPRAVTFISGPSRTGDIEQTIVLGAHGPYRVHLIVVAG